MPADPTLYDLLISIKPAELTENAWLTRAGVNRNFFQSIKQGASPRTDTIDKMVQAVGVAPADFHARRTAQQSNATVIRLEGPSNDKPQGNLPVYGTALAAAREVEGEALEQTTLNKSDIVEYVKRPVLLNGRAGAYALHVQGSSMHPALPDGEMVAVSPDMPLSIGDNVVVYLRPEDPDEDDGQTARAVLVKELVKRSSTYVTLRQYQPAGDFQVPMHQVVRIDRVLTRREMLA